MGVHVTRHARRLARRLASLGDASRGKRLRVAAAGRHSSLRIQVWLENTPLVSEDGDVVVEARYVVNARSYHEVVNTKCR